jgi:hypothetical protein
MNFGLSPTVGDFARACQPTSAFSRLMNLTTIGRLFTYFELSTFHFELLCATSFDTPHDG